jgi:hypothetical protein
MGEGLELANSEYYSESKRMLDEPAARVRRVLKLATLSVNEATTYRTCPKSYFHSYVADGCGYEVLHKSFALTAGDWWHRAQEAWWLARKADLSEEDCLRASLRALDVAKPDERGNVPKPLDPFDERPIGQLGWSRHAARSPREDAARGSRRRRAQDNGDDDRR